MARHPRIYKESIICDTNLKAKPNRNTHRFRSSPCSCWRYHDLHCVTNILLQAEIALPRSHRRVTKIFGIFCTSIYCSFVKFYHRFGYHIETITNDRPIPIVKHVKHNAEEYKSRCKHPYRLLSSPSWIMVTHSDLGNAFPFRYRDHVITPRWFMSVFLLKSDGGTPQSIFFNVFIILKCSVNREINLWHVKSRRFTPGSGGCWGIGFFPTSLI